MQLLKMIGLVMLGAALSIQANESVTILSDTGDTLMIHRLDNGELWGSFMITDQVSDSFSDSELIVLQVDQHQPIKLDHQKLCSSPARDEQKVDYTFQAETATEEWQFSRVATTQPDILKLTGWDKDTYQHMRSDRRPEVVDFPIQTPIAIDSLGPQIRQGNVIVFRYVTSADEARQAEFELQPDRKMINQLFKN
ncbi:MAG: hypothetical protein DRQ35_01830 [Gammaproteobacteria bacterium]|nr:MAG: hypothetical protein DRQ35_01830 [Gammaproteobacteria bacterium]